MEENPASGLSANKPKESVLRLARVDLATRQGQVLTTMKEKKDCRGHMLATDINGQMLWVNDRGDALRPGEGKYRVVALPDVANADAKPVEVAGGKGSLALPPMVDEGGYTLVVRGKSVPELPVVFRVARTDVKRKQVAWKDLGKCD